MADVSWGQLCTDVDAYESRNGWVCPRGWWEGVKIGNEEGANQEAIAKMIQACAHVQSQLDVKLGERQKLARPFAKLRCLAKHNNDVDATVADMLKAMSFPCDSESAFKAGLIPAMPANPSSFPDAFQGVELKDDLHRGQLVADGGNLVPNNIEAYGKMIEASGGKDKAIIGVLSISVCGLALDVQSEWSDHQAWFNKWELACGSFTGAGLSADRILNVPFTIDNYQNQADDECVEIIRKCTGLWMPGGEHYRAVRCLFHHYPGGKRTSASKVYDAIHEMYRKGMCISCTSSGAFVITQGPLITGGSSIHKCLSQGSTVDAKGLRPCMTYDACGGFALLRGAAGEKWENALVDAHCPEKARISRMIRLLSDTKNEPKGTTYGIGIGENTQLVVDHSTSTAEILGFSCVQLVDISVASTPTHPFAIKKVIFHQLSRGDKIDLRSGEITVAPWKVKCVPTAKNKVYTSANVCKEPLCIQKMAETLVNANGPMQAMSTSTETDPVFAVTVSKSSDTTGFCGKPDLSYSIPGHEGKEYWTVLHLEIAIGPL